MHHLDMPTKYTGVTKQLSTKPSLIDHVSPSCVTPPTLQCQNWLPPPPLLQTGGGGVD